MLHNTKTPYELLHQKSADYKNLKDFGCLAFPSTLSQGRHKFDPSVRKCTFLPYKFEVKGYILLDLISREILISTKIHYEGSFPFKPQPLHFDLRISEHIINPSASSDRTTTLIFPDSYPPSSQLSPSPPPRISRDIAASPLPPPAIYTFSSKVY